MTRTGNYCAFYVAEPFNPSALGAHATADFCFFNLLRTWKGQEAAFPFVDSHAKTYSVRDGSNWELTLKPRLRERLRGSKNVVLFLSSNTANSRALREEIDYAINDQGLPIVVIYPGYDSKAALLANGALKPAVRMLWDKIPVFRDSMKLVPTLHIPMKKEIIRTALNNTNFRLATKIKPDIYHYIP